MNLIYTLFLLLFAFTNLFDQTTEPKETFPEHQEIQNEGVPILLEEKELFRIYSNSGNFNTSERALIIQNRIKKIKESQSFISDKIFIVQSENTIDLIYDNSIIMSITQTDAKVAKKNSEDLANEYAQILKNNLKQKSIYTAIDNPDDLIQFFTDKKDVIFKSGIAILSFILYIIINFFLSKLFRKLDSIIDSLKGSRINSFKIKENEIISPETIVVAIHLLFQGFRLSIAIGLIYLFFMEVFLLFPWAKSTSVMEILKGSLLILLTFAIGWGIYKLFKLGLEILHSNIPNWKGSFIEPFKIKTVTVLTEDQIVNLIQKVLQGFQLIFNVFLLYLFLPILFSFFEFTSTWADTLFGYILQPIKSLFVSILGYLPNLFFILVIAGFTKFTNNLIKIFFDEIENGHINFPNFHQDWAEPTYKIVRTLINVFALILIFPYLPGSQSEAFKGISMFIGILFSLGSTSVIANIVSGIVLTYTNAFKIGDRIQLGDITGIVTEKNLLVTRIQTTKQVIITFPNSIAMSSHVINYTTSAKTGKGLIIHTTITLGYDVPWRKIHEVLISSALATESTLAEPKPFVLQTALGDFNVSYEINCYTNKPEKITEIYSNLHQNIQDKCNEAGIEILSPNYIAARDGNHTTIPADNLESNYKTPSFLVELINKMSQKT